MKGPKIGSVPNGVTVNTGMFPKLPEKNEEFSSKFENEVERPFPPSPKNVMKAKAPEGSHYFEDEENNTIISRPIVLQNFQGISRTGWIPPDPVMAVGPNHIMICVNSSFRIFDKSGNVLKTITSASWFNSIASGSGPNDPQVLYDHFAQRWIMVWMTSPTATEHYHLFSISDDDNPLGTWYNWKTDATIVGDSSIHSWGDYPALGFDEQALYLVSRQFPLSAGADFFCKLRIVEKSPLYANTAGKISWIDFWDFREPQNFNVVDFVRPATTFGSPGIAFLMNASPFGNGTYFTLWKISNPVSHPEISAINIPVTAYSNARNAAQLGTSTTVENFGGSSIKNNVVLDALDISQFGSLNHFFEFLRLCQISSYVCLNKIIWQCDSPNTRNKSSTILCGTSPANPRSVNTCDVSQ